MKARLDEASKTPGSDCFEIIVDSNVRIEACRGATLLEILRTSGFQVEAPCNGRGICGKCRLKASGSLSDPEAGELRHLGASIEEGIRLACQTAVLGPAAIDLEKSGAEALQITEEGRGERLVLNPSIKRVRLEPSIREEKESVSIWESLKPASHAGIQFRITPSILRRLALKWRSGPPPYIEAVVRGSRLLSLRFEPGKKCLGIALDIGTTTLVAELMDLETGKTLGLRSCLNPQAAFGGDVLTRISYGIEHPDGIELLQRQLVNGINRLIEELCLIKEVEPSDIFELVVAANTTMLHLLLGIDPRFLASSPYQPVFTDSLHVSPESISIRMAPEGVVVLLPSAAAFVGADILAGLLATGFDRFSEPSLFIDIGTNGEIVASASGLLIGSSSAAGPALEGMAVSCGCRAKRGAVQAVSISLDGALHLDIIGSGAPTGICGSGLIDLIAELLRAGAIEPSGRLANKEALPRPLSRRMGEIAGQRAFFISRKENLFLTQKDIRQVQLAKGAIAAGISLVIKELGLSFSDLERVLVAGAFGAHLKPSSLAAIGLLPFELMEKVVFVGNTAKEGAKMVLTDCASQAKIELIRRKLIIKELSLLPEFQDCFVRNLGFPGRR